VIHQLILKARSGPSAVSNIFPHPFKKIILVGHSLGSIIANNLNAMYPKDVDATILGGFSKDWFLAVPGFILTANLLPAAIVEPTRYGTYPIGR
jgi:pimeloyl-ACP methyl ester carboxylesterase